MGNAQGYGDIVMGYNNAPTVDVDLRLVSNHEYVARGRVWPVANLHRAALEQELVVFKIPLAAIRTDIKLWDVDDIDEFLMHCRKLELVDMKYPIILDVYGSICDGYHRIAKAILKGDTYIDGVRLRTMPSSTKEECNE